MGFSMGKRTRGNLKFGKLGANTATTGASTYGEIVMLTMGRPDQYSTDCVSPLRCAVNRARAEVEYK
jgi:hypothetical protein